MSEADHDALKDVFEKSGQFRFSTLWNGLWHVVADLRHKETPDLSNVCDWRRVCVRPRWNGGCPVLSTALPLEAKKPRKDPPRPSPEERKPRPWSENDILAHLASLHALNPTTIVSLKVPARHAIVDLSRLVETFAKLKTYLANRLARKGFPPSILTTEFDFVSSKGQCNYAANFHLYSARPLTAEEQDELKNWWLKLWGVEDNRGGYFHHAARGGGLDLILYASKQRSNKGDAQKQEVRHFVRFRPPWMPAHTDQWFWCCLGCDRKSADEGREIVNNLPPGYTFRLVDTETEANRKLIEEDLKNFKKHQDGLIAWRGLYL